MEKKDAARILYNEGYSQKDIGQMMRISANTISRWSREGNWKEKKLSIEMKSDNSIQRIIDLIDYQTRALKRKVEIWQEVDPVNPRLIERGDIDALQKLFTTIRQDAKKFSDYVHVMKEFVTWLQVENLNLAKELTSYMDEFINEKRKVL